MNVRACIHNAMNPKNVYRFSGLLTFDRSKRMMSETDTETEIKRKKAIIIWRKKQKQI